MKKLDTTTYKIDEKFYTKVETPKKKIVLTETGFNDMKHLSKLTINEYEPMKCVPHFTITENGEIYQHFDTEYYSNIVEDDKINQHSINISFVNLGWLTYMIGKDVPVNWCGIEVNDEDRIFEFSTDYRNCTFFHSFTKKQISSAVELSLYLIEKHGIKKDFNIHAFLMDGIDPVEYEGICSRSSLSLAYKDVSPAFDFKNFSKLLNK